MNAISKLRFDALAGYSRSPILALTADELGWFADANEKVLGVLIRDIPDLDYAYCILGRDAHGRYRAVNLAVNIPTKAAAHTRLTKTLDDQAQLPPSAFYQGDETGKPRDFFTPVVAPDKLHPLFRTLISTYGFSPTLGLLTELMHYFEDADGNFVQQFQTTGFDARVWELYLYAVFTELGYAFDRDNPAPDFHCQGLRGDFFIEATTVNPSADAPIIDENNQEEYFAHYVPMKFGSALFSKLKKEYWKLAHVAGHPLTLAIQDFHAPQSMAWSSAALSEYLYGIRQIDKKQTDGTLAVASERVEKYVWEGKEIPAGFFLQPQAEHISAVLANPSGTLSKCNRMGFLAGFGARDLQMTRRGICYRKKVIPEPFVVEVHAPGYTETWCEGLSVYHNPNALHPLPKQSIPGAAHFTARDGKILGTMPPFFPVGSVTMTRVPKHKQTASDPPG